MNQFVIQRTGHSHDDSSIASIQYFAGSIWSSCPSQACAYSYDEAVSRIIVMNVLDSGNRYEAVLCENETSSASVKCINKDLERLLTETNRNS